MICLPQLVNSCNCSRETREEEETTQETVLNEFKDYKHIPKHINYKIYYIKIQETPKGMLNFMVETVKN